MIGKLVMAMSITSLAVAAPRVIAPDTKEFLGYQFEVGPMGLALSVCFILAAIKLCERSPGRERPNWVLKGGAAVLSIILTIAVLATQRPDLVGAAAIGGTLGAAGVLIVKVFERNTLDRILSIFGYERKGGRDG